MAKRFAQNSGSVRSEKTPAQKEKRKPRGKPFSGRDDPRRNNGGVPAVVRELKEIAQGDGPTLWKLLMQKAKRGNAIAIVKGLEFVFGKPRQMVELTGKDGGPVQTNQVIDPRALTDEQLEFIERLYASARAALPGGGAGGESAAGEGEGTQGV